MILTQHEALRQEIQALSFRFLRNVLSEDTAKYGSYRVQDGEFHFMTNQKANIPADRVTEWSVAKTGGKIKFFDKASAIALARSIGVFELRETDAETEDLSEAALFDESEST